MFQIYIHGLSNEKHTLDICECEIEFKNMSILQLKEKLITSKNLPMSWYKTQETQCACKWLISKYSFTSTNPLTYSHIIPIHLLFTYQLLNNEA